MGCQKKGLAAGAAVVATISSTLVQFVSANDTQDDTAAQFGKKHVSKV